MFTIIAAIMPMLVLVTGIEEERMFPSKPPIKNYGNLNKQMEEVGYLYSIGEDERVRGNLNKQMEEVGYLYSIGEDERKTLDEEMFEAVEHVKRMQLGQIRTKNWQCQKVKKINLAFCNEWKKRWTSLTVYLAYYSEFGRKKIGAQIVKALKRHPMKRSEQMLQVITAQKIEESGMLDHLALKPHFKGSADGSKLTFTAAIDQCYSAYKALFAAEKNSKFSQIYQWFCGGGTCGQILSQIRPQSEFVNEKECIFVNEWVRAYKKAIHFGQNEARVVAQFLLTSMVPMIENDEPIPALILRQTVPLNLRA